MLTLNFDRFIHFVLFYFAS